MKNGYCYNIEYQFVKKNGKVIDCLLSAISEQDKEGNIIRSLAVITDITERKKVDQALRESEEQYRTLIEKIQAAVVVHNADTSILMSNSLAQEFLGLTRDQMLGKMSIDPYWHFSDENGKYVDIDKYPVNLVLSTGKKLRNYVLRVHRPSLENEVWVLVNADPVYNKDKQIIQVIVTFIDITQRKKAQSDLEEERKLFIGGPNVAFKWKSDEGWSIEYVSPNIAKVFGYSPEYLMNSKIKYINLIHQNDLKYITDEIRINEEKKLSYFELEYRIIRADGEPRWIYNFITVVRDSNGEVTHYNGHIIDITEDKQAKDEIQKLNLNLEQRVAERTKQLESLNKELESFSYSISHDLREPLFHIEGYIRLLEEKVNSSLDNEGRSFISSIYKSTKHMTHLIDDILTFSRTGYQELIFNSVDMSKLVDDVIVEFKTEFLNRTIHWNISSLPEVKGDKILLHQVFTNLISNAIKFSAHKTQAKIDIGHLVSESENIFYVRDNGAGFDMKFVNRLFNTFERLHSKEEYKGTGIGLANVRRIIERHGGRTWADGEVNKGATFYFSIPNEIIR
jgi:PAS domain S-box-containing protein